MKKRKFSLVFAMLFALSRVTFAQSGVGMIGPLGDSLKAIAERFTTTVVGDEKCIPFFFFDTHGDQIDAYLGLITSKFQLREAKPTFYFVSSKGTPIFCFMGLEQNLQFSKDYLDEIETIANKFLLPEEIVFNAHYLPWHACYRESKQVFLKKGLSKKDRSKIPKWFLPLR